MVPSPWSHLPSKAHLTWLQANDEVVTLGSVLQASGEAGMECNHRHPSHQGGKGHLLFGGFGEEAGCYEIIAQWSGHTENATESNFKVSIDLKAFSELVLTFFHFCRTPWFTCRRQQGPTRI